ncbi:MAG: hypothetical protein U0176_22290 [Bacteroidia bacterium]
MKKRLYLLLMAAGILAACNPPANTTVPGNSDSTSTALQDSHPLVDTVETVVADSSVRANPDPAGDPATDPGNNSNSNTSGGGRVANPNADLNAKRFAVTGRILLQTSYCGGAAPSDEILAEYEKPKPYGSQPLLIRSGKTNALGTAMVTRTTTAADGTFKLDLPAGTYCLVIAEKEGPRQPGFYQLETIAVDKACDNKWLNTCDISFTVADKPVSGLRLTLQKKCFIDQLSPCLSYSGPLPPSAAPRGGR